MSTITRTSKGYQVQQNGRTSNIGAAFTHVVLYSTGGWRTGQIADLPTFSKHKSEAAALKQAQEHVAFSGGTFQIIDLATAGEAQA